MIYLVGKDKSIAEVSSDLLVNELSKYDKIGVDTETTGLDPHLHKLNSIQLCGGDSMFVLKADQDNSFLKPLFEGKATKIFHNAKFDLKFLIKNGFKVNNVYDTMIAERLITNGDGPSRISLKKLLKSRLNVELDKEERQNIRAPFDSWDTPQILYAAFDTQFLSKLYDQQMAEITENKLNAVTKLENNLVIVLAKMELQGVLIDVERWKTMADENDRMLNEFKNKLDDVVKSDSRLEKFVSTQLDLFSPERSVNINYKSSKQKSIILKHLGYDIGFFDTKTGKQRENSGWKGLLKFKGDAFIDALIDYSKMTSLCNTFGHKYLKSLNPVTKSLHPEFQQLTAVTGRMGTTGVNILNIPKDNRYRNSFIAPKGYKMITSDFSGCELCFIADLADDDFMITTLNKGEDLHSLIACKVFKTHVSSTENKHLRTIAKSVTFGLAYGATAAKVAETANIPLAQAEHVLKEYFKLFPKLKSTLESVGQYGLENRRITNFTRFKRQRRFKEGSLEKADIGRITRQAKNFVIQSANADLTKMSLIMLDKFSEEHPEYDVRIVNAVHDEIVCICKEEYVEEVQKEKINIMVNTCGKFFSSKVDFKVDSHIADFWLK